MKKKPEIMLLCSFIGILAIELLIHWFLARQTVPILTRFYLSESKRNSITTLVDNFLPGIALGVAGGWFGWGWSTRRFIFSVALLDVGIVTSEFLYHFFFQPNLLWWWPPTTGDIIFRFLTTLVFLFLFASGVRKNRRKRLAGQAAPIA